MDRDYAFIDLAEEGGNHHLPKGVDYFGSVAVPEEAAVIEYVRFFSGVRPYIVYRGKRVNDERFAFFMPYPQNGNGAHSTESEVDVKQDVREEGGG